VRWHGQGRCYGSILWPVVRVCSSLYMKALRIAEDPSSGSFVQCLAKNYKNHSIVSVDMDTVGVMAAYCDPLCVCVVHCIWRHFGSQRIHHQGALYSAWLKITRMILSCALTWTRSVLWQHILHNFNCIYILYIVHWLDNKVFKELVIAAVSKQCTVFSFACWKFFEPSSRTPKRLKMKAVGGSETSGINNRTTQRKKSEHLIPFMWVI